MGCEYVNEKLGKNVGTYMKMENSEYWAEGYFKENYAKLQVTMKEAQIALAFIDISLL